MFFADFKAAASDYSEGMKLMSQLKLWRFAIIPALIAISLVALIIYLAFEFSDSIGIYISNFWPFEFWQASILAVSNFIGGVLVVIVGFMMYKNMIIAFSSPFMTPVSERIEQHLLGQKVRSELNWATTLVRSIRINTRNFLLEILITVPLLILSLIPVLNLATTVLLFFIGAFYVGFGNLDYTLERHKKYADSIQFVKANKGTACGNGALFMLALLVPVVGVLFILPLSTAASTVSAVKKLKLKQ